MNLNQITIINRALNDYADKVRDEIEENIEYATSDLKNFSFDDLNDDILTIKALNKVLQDTLNTQKELNNQFHKELEQQKQINN